MSKHSRGTILGSVLLVPLLLLGLALGRRGASAGAQVAVSGAVVDGSGPVAGARVRVRATENMVRSGEDGRFTLADLQAGSGTEITAWADGYYVAAVHVTPPAAGVTITLRAYHTEDHPAYTWAGPLSGTGACGECHPGIVSEWLSNAHAAAIDNPQFYSLYNGTNTGGDLQIAPGYLHDFPGTAGNCATCHAPGAAADAPYTTHMNDVRGEVTAGIHCDFCHKVGGVDLDEETGSVRENQPGVQSLRLLRPPPNDDIFFGPFDDVHDPDTYLPLVSESQYCAPCHQFSFAGTPIYESFDEWLASPYAAHGVTCQDCHMPPAGNSTFAPPEVGGVVRRPDTIPSHWQLGAGRDEFETEYATLMVETEQQGRQLMVTIYLKNQGAGHHFPTDFPGRHVLLTVQARDTAGRPLPLLSGTRVPEWGGAQAGLPGKAFAKILADAQTGAAPVVSYWKPTVILSDNRIPAFAADGSSYLFLLPPGSGTAEVAVEVRYRHLFAELMAEKEWTAPDDITAAESRSVPYDAQWAVFVPVAH